MMVSNIFRDRPCNAQTHPSSTTWTGHVALITGANHGIGAAIALASCGAAALISYLRIPDDPDDLPERYRTNRAKTADDVLAVIHEHGGQAVAMEADLTDAGATPRLFDYAEDQLGPVDILVNNATGWVADTFTTTGQHVIGMGSAGLTAATHDQVFGVGARSGALMIAEFARRHIEREAGWGRIIGLTSGGPLGFPNEVSYGAAKAALENYTMSAAAELAPFSASQPTSSTHRSPTLAGSTTRYASMSRRAPT